jgi:hypothetical protein
MREDEVGSNPLEPTARPPVKPGLRLAALVIIGSGLLSLGSLIVELFAGNAASVWAWGGLSAIILVFLTRFCPMVFAVGGIVRGILLSRSTTHRNLSQVSQFAIGGVVFQLVAFAPLVTQVVSGHGLTPGALPSPAYWVALAGFLIMLAVAELVSMIARPPITEQDVYDEARYHKMEEMSRGANDDIRVKAPPPQPPMPGHL